MIKSRILLFLILLVLSQIISGQVNFEKYLEAQTLNNSALEDIKNEFYSSSIGKSIQALQYDSLNRLPYVNLNYACHKTGDYDLLLGYLENAKTIFEEDDEILYYLANTYLKLGVIDSAISNYNLAIKYSFINGEDFPLVYAYYLNRGICYNIQNKYEIALKDFNYSVKLNKNAGAAYANRALSYLRLKKMDEACADWKLAKLLEEETVDEYIVKYCR